ncbi:Uncharacterised protein [Neisseria subflava]|uniref:Uncharacterized protein n=1 Tax=Neisseria subflava TaxID=28449 RepID=A0A9X9SMB9_NEISU|nr:Uncharacterised protein [Neisseria subflava]
MNLYQTTLSCYRFSPLSADPVVVCLLPVAAV